MTEEQMKAAIRGFLQSSMAGDVTKALSFLADDVVYVVPEGTFKGTAEMKRYMAWNNQMVKDGKATETGIGIIIHGNIGVIEHNLSGTIKGIKGEILAVCIYEFKDDKIQSIKGFYDRLGMAKQGAKGWLAKWMVNTIVSQAEKGLH
jgi:hypothetical protein